MIFISSLTHECNEVRENAYNKWYKNTNENYIDSTQNKKIQYVLLVFNL